MGIARFGSIIKFIPYPVTIGFTSGIALIIFTTQIKDFLGLRIDNLPADFIGIRTQPLITIRKSLLFDKIGNENICVDIDKAIERAKFILKKQV